MSGRATRGRDASKHSPLCDGKIFTSPEMSNAGAFAPEVRTFICFAARRASCAAIATGPNVYVRFAPATGSGFGALGSFLVLEVTFKAIGGTSALGTAAGLRSRSEGPVSFTAGRGFGAARGLPMRAFDDTGGGSGFVRRGESVSELSESR